MARLLEASYRDLENRVQERTNELARMVDKNAELYRRASEAVQMRDEFLSIASHELKTPLTALQLHLQLLVQKLQGTQRERDLAESSLRDTRRLARLLDELLDLTRIRLNKLELKRERCNLAALAMDVVAQFSAEAARAGSQLHYEPGAPVMGSCDPVRISQVLTNLVSNAIKYGAGRPIRVGVRASGPGWAELRVADQGQGQGIAEDERERIFERFERADSAQRASGLGLGLYVSRQIVLAHAGEISVESSPAGGSVFTVRIPTVQAAETGAALEAGADAAGESPVMR
jgi:two-component system, sensor histidine kinase